MAGDGQLRRPGVGAERLAAVGDEAGLVAEETFWANTTITPNSSSGVPIAAAAP